MFPEKPDFDNPLTEAWGAISGNNSHLNFGLKNKEKTNFKAHSNMEMKSFDPDEVRKVELYGNSSTCFTIRFFDSRNNQIAQIGWITGFFKLLEFELHENERIVGIVCHNNDTNGYVFDLQFVICKKLDK